MQKRYRIQVEGIVQGVGFRPFVYALASTYHLGGFVLNNSAGVLIEVEGDQQALTCFLRKLREQPPPHATIQRVICDPLPPRGDGRFAIAASQEGEERDMSIAPDLAVCDACLRELFDPTDRRYRYPFISCTNCGPRFTILRMVPYDRGHTTMAAFPMCWHCEQEYHDPTNRRFHAQTNACARCGPAVRLVKPDGSEVPVRDPVSAAAQLVRAGAILALKGLGGYHLTCNALDEDAILTLRRRKKREEKPFALMAAAIHVIEQFCHLNDQERALLQSPQRPIVLLRKKDHPTVAPSVAPGQNCLGWMLPSTPLHCLLLADTGLPLVMTSGNVSAEPIVYRDEDALQRLGGIADYLLVHDRSIQVRCDDSVVRQCGERELILRRARGYAPRPVLLSRPFRRHTLACGAHLKNTVCLGRDRQAFLSHHIGDLDSYDTLNAFVDTIEQYKALLGIQPSVVAYDLHPDSLSRKYAASLQGVEKIGVQHHHAHIASCMAEYGLEGPVIGVAFDGLGYGPDGTLWGGEFLIADLATYHRAAHFRSVSLAGGERAVREPWRAALSYIADALGTTPSALELPGWQRVDARKAALVEHMLARNVNTFRTSSCGRLFDAVASIVGICHEATFEGQAAMALEAAAWDGIADEYPFAIENTEPWHVDMRPTIEALVREARSGCETGLMAAKFHNTLVSAVVEICLRLRKTEGLRQVCLSGGTWQNIYLLERVVPRLQHHGFTVFVPAQVPPNDGGIALGQAVVANMVSE
ncbi:MAG: carbamoyltransferase HypF [Candidatus Binatia bacterium]|nr:carbamoyltransferase HypF [Candidatus Binatia bacterium]